MTHKILFILNFLHFANLVNSEALAVDALPPRVALFEVALEGAERHVALVAARAAVVARTHVRLPQVAAHVARVPNGFRAQDAEVAGLTLLDLRVQQLLEGATLVIRQDMI